MWYRTWVRWRWPAIFFVLIAFTTKLQLDTSPWVNRVFWVALIGIPLAVILLQIYNGKILSKDLVGQPRSMRFVINLLFVVLLLGMFGVAIYGGIPFA